MNRKIPSVMVSQHPDNARNPYWHKSAFVSDQYEVKECFLSFSKLNAPEYKWDWEGKFVEESVFERLISFYPAFFKKYPLGKKKFLTFRLPDFRVESEFRLGRAFMCIITAAELASHLGLHSPPIFEAILPMTKSAQELIWVESAYEEMASLKNNFNIKNKGILKHLELIPLFEDIRILVKSPLIIKEYIKLHEKKFGFVPEYIRPYLARSDSALSSGLIPSVLAIKIALSGYNEAKNFNGVEIFPIIGAGSLPFRGGFTPYSFENFLKEYKGVKTVLVQSGFQYDFPLENVIAAIKKTDKLLKKSSADLVDLKDKNEIVKNFEEYEKIYQGTVKKIGSLVYKIATSLPYRRQRLIHTGLLKYPRRIGKVKVPRAIGFTASLYSIGIPPELIGTGRVLKKAKESGRIHLIKKYYTGLKEDLLRSGRFLNKKVLNNFSKKFSVFDSIKQDVERIEKYLGKELSPSSDEEKEHEKITYKIYKNFIEEKPITELIEKAGILRNSLG